MPESMMPEPEISEQDTESMNLISENSESKNI